MTLTFVEFVVTLNSQNADKKLPNTVHSNPLHLMFRRCRRKYFLTERHIFKKLWIQNSHNSCFLSLNIRTIVLKEETLKLVHLRPPVVLLFLSWG